MSDKKSKDFGAFLSSLFPEGGKDFTPEEVLGTQLSPQDQEESAQFQAYIDDLALQDFQKMQSLTEAEREERLAFNAMVTEDALNIFKEKKPHFDMRIQALGSIKSRSGNMNHYVRDVKGIVDELNNTAVHNPLAQMMLANDIWNQEKGVGFLAKDMERFIRVRGGVVTKWGSRFPPNSDFVETREPA